MAYNVDTDVFRGPFDLLLHLVRINEMDIYDISIAEITKKYLEAIEEMKDIDLVAAGETADAEPAPAEQPTPPALPVTEVIDELVIAAQTPEPPPEAPAPAQRSAPADASVIDDLISHEGDH